jgi:hypothetical protein
VPYVHVVLYLHDLQVRVAFGLAQLPHGLWMTALCRTSHLHFLHALHAQVHVSVCVSLDADETLGKGEVGVLRPIASVVLASWTGLGNDTNGPCQTHNPNHVKNPLPGSRRVAGCKINKQPTPGHWLRWRHGPFAGSGVGNKVSFDLALTPSAGQCLFMLYFRAGS